MKNKFLIVGLLSLIATGLYAAPAELNIYCPAPNTLSYSSNTWVGAYNAKGTAIQYTGSGASGTVQLVSNSNYVATSSNRGYMTCTYLANLSAAQIVGSTKTETDLTLNSSANSFQDCGGGLILPFNSHCPN